MKIFQVIVLIAVCAMITLTTVFASAMFQAITIEGGYQYEGMPILAFGQVNAWVVVVSALMIIAVLVVAFKLFRESTE